MEWGIQELGAHEYFESGESRAEEAAVMRAWRDCRAQFNLNEIIVSEGFATRFRELERGLPGVVDRDLDPPTRARLEYQCFQVAHPELLQLAKEDIDPNHDGSTQRHWFDADNAPGSGRSSRA